jgi:hypothetical protein
LDIYDVLEFEEAKSEFNIVYFDRLGALISVPNMFAILPGQGGITSPYNALEIIMEILGYRTYKLHTIEVHNPETCNLNNMTLIRLNSQQNVLDNYPLNSQRVNNVTFIDVDYYKYFENLNTAGDDPDYLRINFLNTIDNKNPTKCELRGFGEVSNFRKINKNN